MANTRCFESAYELFSYYYTHNMDIMRTLKDYGLVTGRASTSDYTYKWRELKKKYPEDYQNAKSDWLDFIGINQPSVFEKIYNIACNSPLDRDKLRALELLCRYRENIADTDIVSNANKLSIEIVPTPTEVEQMAEEIVYYEE